MCVLKVYEVELRSPGYRSDVVIACDDCVLTLDYDSTVAVAYDSKNVIDCVKSFNRLTGYNIKVLDINLSEKGVSDVVDRLPLVIRDMVKSCKCKHGCNCRPSDVIVLLTLMIFSSTIEYIKMKVRELVKKVKKLLSKCVGV